MGRESFEELNKKKQQHTKIKVDRCKKCENEGEESESKSERNTHEIGIKCEWVYESGKKKIWNKLGDMMNCKCMTCWQNGPMDCRHHHRRRRCRRHCQRVHLYKNLNQIHITYVTMELTLVCKTFYCQVLYLHECCCGCCSYYFFSPSISAFYLFFSLSPPLRVSSRFMREAQSMLNRKHIFLFQYLWIASHLNFNSTWAHNT